MKIDSLTPQQHCVAQMVADGQTDKAIATALCVSVRTVRYHIRAIAVAWDLPKDRVTRVEIARRAPKRAA